MENKSKSTIYKILVIVWLTVCVGAFVYLIWYFIALTQSRIESIKDLTGLDDIFIDSQKRFIVLNAIQSALLIIALILFLIIAIPKIVSLFSTLSHFKKCKTISIISTCLFGLLTTYFIIDVIYNIIVCIGASKQDPEWYEFYISSIKTDLGFLFIFLFLLASFLALAIPMLKKSFRPSSNVNKEIPIE